MDGGSELSDVEDVFVGEEAELPRMIRCEERPSEEEVKSTIERMCLIAAGAPTASEAKRGEITAGG